MAFRPLTEGDCGQVNPLTKLTSHITQDHAFAETHGQIFPSTSDQLVEQFLQETRAVPQSFRMDGTFEIFAFFAAVGLIWGLCYRLDEGDARN